MRPSVSPTRATFSLQVRAACSGCGVMAQATRTRVVCEAVCGGEQVRLVVGAHSRNPRCCHAGEAMSGALPDVDSPSTLHGEYLLKCDAARRAVFSRRVVPPPLRRVCRRYGDGRDGGT